MLPLKLAMHLPLRYRKTKWANVDPKAAEFQPPGAMLAQYNPVRSPREPGPGAKTGSLARPGRRQLALGVAPGSPVEAKKNPLISELPPPTSRLALPAPTV